MFLLPKNIRNTRSSPVRAAKRRDRSKYRHLFFDLDHTLWDFEANAKVTLIELYIPYTWKKEESMILIFFIKIICSIMKSFGNDIEMVISNRKN